MSVKIPESAYSAIQALIRLSPNDFQAFRQALSRATPSLDPDNFWNHVAPHVSPDNRVEIKSIVNEIVQMATALGDMDSDVEEFSETIAGIVFSSNSEAFPITEEERNVLKHRLVELFKDNKGLNITTKAMGVALDQDRIFYSAKIITDVRPVFNQKGDVVEAAVIVHHLHIHYGQDNEHKDFYVALDTNDIQELRKALDRADTKAQTLEALLKRSEVSYLDVEG